MQETSYLYIDPIVLFRMVQCDLSAFRKLSKTFLEIAPPMFARLETALQMDVAPKIAQASHSLRGATALVGAKQLTDVLIKMESAARAEQKGGSVVELAELKQLFSLTVQEVQSSILSFAGAATSAAERAPVTQAKDCP